VAPASACWRDSDYAENYRTVSALLRLDLEIASPERLLDGCVAALALLTGRTGAR
jgi:hypothetical protein